MSKAQSRTLRSARPSNRNPPDEAFSKLRSEMVERAIAARGVRSKQVLSAMRNVPREAFLPHQLREFAYSDCPLPIEEGQTISQPYIVAFMTEALALEGGERVLEIGTGSGYAAAILAEIAGDVYTVERIGQLAEKAAATLADLGYDNVHVLHGDGTKGWPDHAPYDGIIVAAGGPKIPESLKKQLKIGGRLVIPVGNDPKIQELVRVTRISENEYRREDLADVRFVPLIGHEGWVPSDHRPTVAPSRPDGCDRRRGSRRRRRLRNRASRRRSALPRHHRRRRAQSLRSHRHGLAREERDYGDCPRQRDDQGARTPKFRFLSAIEQ